MPAGQVVIHRIEIQRLKLFVRTLPALDPGLLANNWFPLILTGDSISGAASGPLPANRIDILSAAKKRPEQFGFLIRGQLRVCGTLRSGMKLTPPGKKESLFLLKLG